jgi:hypothetical protein
MLIYTSKAKRLLPINFHLPEKKVGTRPVLLSQIEGILGKSGFLSYA